MQDFKDSLFLPKTDFPMRGNLINNEPIKYNKWNEQKVYNKIIQNHKGAQTWTLHDGPPYANGNIHIGHALNKILKDIIVKYHYFGGYDVRFTPGWDCHGLPIEQKVEEKIGGAKKKELPKSKLRQLCRDHATKYIDIQKQEFKTLGVLADWKNPYLTMKFRFEADIYKELVNISKQGLLIQRSKPVHWSWAAKTALAEAEVEYQDKVSPSIYVAFKLKDEDVSIIIWTTTPWTLPANSGICLNGNEKYIQTSDNFIVAKKLYQSLKDDGVVNGDIIKEINPKTLENCLAINPLNKRDSKIILGEHVLMDSGTGAVHTAPGHGEDDYKVGLKYNLEVIMPVADNGTFDESITRDNLLPEEFLGINIFKANDKILELLGSALLKKVDITHSYPHCWRTHKPVIFRATKQWFIAMDKPYGTKQKTLRQNTLEAIENITFYPNHGVNRLKAMITDRPDWCISRQRDWGVPIAFFKDKRTGDIIYDENVLNHIANIFEKHGADAWYDMSIKELLSPKSTLVPDDLEKTMDILDVWFDSGSTQNAVLKSPNYDAGSFPADMYLEGSDQHRGWFQSSLLTSLASSEIAPYKSILTHGFTVDEKGEKMSKSKGNVVAPDKVIKQFGSEILRLWVAMSDYQNDLKISNNILKQTAEQYRKIRNTGKILLGNIHGLEKFVDTKDLQLLDKWILNKANIVFGEVEEAFKTYDFSKGLNKLNNFLVADLSNIYIDISKDSLYCDDKNSPKRASIQSAMGMILKKLIHTLSPILTYTTDELLEYAPKIIKDKANNIFDIEVYNLPDIQLDGVDMDRILLIKEKFSEIKDKLTKEKTIKSTLELVIITDDKDILSLGKAVAEDIFIVSRILDVDKFDNKYIDIFKFENSKFYIQKSKKEKCPRCWKYKSNNEIEVCKRCNEVIK